MMSKHKHTHTQIIHRLIAENTIPEDKYLMKENISYLQRFEKFFFFLPRIQKCLLAWSNLGI